MLRAALLLVPAQETELVAVEVLEVERELGRSS
jgi:hypothetical protein